MSIALYEKLEALLELYRQLGEAEIESMFKAPPLAHKDLMKQLRNKIHG